MKNQKCSSKELKAKILQFVSLIRSKGYGLNRSWVVTTPNHKIRNWKIGGQMILDIDNKWKESHGLTIELIDETISELNAHSELWYRHDNN